MFQGTTDKTYLSMSRGSSLNNLNAIQGKIDLKALHC